MAGLSVTLTKDRTFPVNFTCQRCCQPLRLDASFSSIDEQTLSELSEPMLSQSEPVELCGPSPAVHYRVPDEGVSRRTVEPIRFVESGNGFMLVGDSAAVVDTTISHRLDVETRLFELMTNQSAVDYPICEECTDNLLDQMERQLDLAEDECKDYKKYLDQLTNGDEDDVNLEELDAEYRKLEQEERELLAAVEKIEKERSDVASERKQLADRLERLRADEDRYWREYSDLNRQLMQCSDDHASVERQLKYSENKLSQLQKTNVFNATFHIWHNGHFGTINNFRLGRLPNVPVEWSEINMAWGQTVLLLHSLAQKMEMTFLRYRLVPFGNHSYLMCLEDPSRELPLYFAGGFKFLWDTKFDHAMVAFLDCLQQFKEQVSKMDSNFCLPYRIDKGKIEDTNTGQSCSIKIQFNSEEQWTKALKFMLTNLKWGLAWVSAHFAAREAGS
uniref:Putative beclin-like protein n=1 Tax=Hyalomma excavatum TaxID=257692 RepID=A0A131XIJ3_9ACAR